MNALSILDNVRIVPSAVESLPVKAEQFRGHEEKRNGRGQPFLYLLQ